MSKLTRALALAAMLAAMNLAGMTAAAHATQASDRPTSQDAKHPATQDRVTAPQQAAADTAHRRELAQERSYSTWGYTNPAVQQALAQERSYSTSGYGDNSAPAPAAPGGQADRLVPTLGVLATVMALVAVVAVLVARRATRIRRAGQTA
jgi:cobalamin biosynthesis Mg chelatase CobN